MAGANTGLLELPYQASATVTKQRFVVLTGNQTVARASVLGSEVLGVAKVSVQDLSTAPYLAGGPHYNEITAGKGSAVQILGVAHVEASAPISRGANVATAADGRSVTAAVGNKVAGKALTPAAAAGDLHTVLLAQYGTQLTA